MSKSQPGVVKRVIKHKDGTTTVKWYARVKIQGRSVWRACPNYQTAIDTVAKLKEEARCIRLGLPVAPKGSETLFSQVVKDYLEWSKAHKRSWDRDRQSLDHLQKFFGDYYLTDITPKSVEDYRKKRKTEIYKDGRAKGNPPSNGTLNREVRCLTRLLRWAVERRLIPDSPLKGIKMLPEAPPRVPTLDTETEAHLLSALPEWARLPIKMALLTGARAGEIVQAKWRDINLELGFWTIPDSKNLSPRTVPLNSELIELLKPLQGLPEAYVVTRNGKPICVHDLTAVFKKTVRRIGRPDLRLHDLRHVFASRLLANGASLPEIAALLGHKTLSISARYSHASPERLRALVGTLPSVKPAESARIMEFPKKE
jgi:integrase